MTVRRALWMSLCACCWTMQIPCGAAQDAAPPPSTDPVYTLHVYEDLVQVTALVMNHERQVETHLGQGDFKMQLDAGPAFHPRHLRLEGDDPITLAVVVDESWEGAEESTRALGEAFARLPAGLFTERDRISVFAFDCNLLMAARDVPALSPVVPSLFPKVLRTDALHRSAGGKERCARHVHLWDALAQVGRLLESTPGRRVLAVLSPGDDSESVNRPDGLRHFLAGKGATVFGAIPVEPYSQPVKTGSGREAPFALLCGGTGGFVTEATRGTLLAWVRETLTMLRQRYVLEFARPANEAAGLHQLDVTTSKRTDRVYVSGVTVPLRDQRLAQDPYTVPNDPNRAPVIGTRKMLSPR